MLDNYGQEVPTDLVSLTHGPDAFTDAEVKAIVNARWYDVVHSHGEDLAVSFYEVGCLELLEPISNPLGDTPIEVMQVNEVLKRWSVEDGFYHA